MKVELSQKPSGIGVIYFFKVVIQKNTKNRLAFYYLALKTNLSLFIFVGNFSIYVVINCLQK